MFFYDSTLQLYINDEPLLVSSKILGAAKRAGVTLSWNEHGFINKIPFSDVKALSSELGSVMLTIREFMNLAKREPRVASRDFAEWLDDTFTLSTDNRMIDANGDIFNVPAMRPGWFDLDSIDEDGLPTAMTSLPAVGKWKFWSQNDHSFTAAAVRSFVTSSGTCSLDLGIPSFARHPNFMVRECYRTVPPVNDNPLDRIWTEYEAVTFSRNDEDIGGFFRSLDMEGISQSHEELDGFIFEKNNERLTDLVGKKRLIEENFDNLRAITIEDISQALSILADAETTYVIGHEHPDADSIVSSVFEATRRQLFYQKACVAWSDGMPYVVRKILGERISDSVMKTPKFGSTNDVVLVDCHSIDSGREYQVKSVIDHHIISRKFPHYVSISQEVSWSSTVQVYIKFLGSGLDLDAETARILLEATILEAEPSLINNMSVLDKLVLERLRMLAQSYTSYPDLMAMMTSDSRGSDLFMADYKQRLYGFAVIKTRKLASFEKRAKANNIERHLPLTVLKQVLYDSQFQSVLEESITMYFNDNFYDKGFRDAIMHVTRAACEAFHGARHVTSNKNQIKVSGVPHQTPRLLLAPLLEGIVAEHLRFFHSKAVGMYVACGFYTDVEGDYSSTTTNPPPTTRVSFDNAKTLLSGKVSTSWLTLPQYWQVYRECEALGDMITLKSLRDPKYVELLNTVICSRQDVIHEDRKPTRPTILEAKPALIRPQDVDSKSGLPTRLVSPDTYGENSLWRYWSPDRDENVATRGHIFVMDQTCIDLKIMRHERTQQLTFRPIYRDIPKIKYTVSSDGGSWVKIEVFPRLFSIKSESDSVQSSSRLPSLLRAMGRGKFSVRRGKTKENVETEWSGSE